MPDGRVTFTGALLDDLSREEAPCLTDARFTDTVVADLLPHVRRRHA